MDNAKLGFVEGIEVVDGKDDSVRTVTRIIINVQRELGKQMYDRPVIILTVEEWDALQAELGMEAVMSKMVEIKKCRDCPHYGHRAWWRDRFEYRCTLANRRFRGGVPGVIPPDWCPLPDMIKGEKDE